MASLRSYAVLSALALTPFVFPACGGSESTSANGTAKNGQDSGTDTTNGDSGAGGAGSSGTPLSDAPAVLSKALCTVAASCLVSAWDLFLKGQDCETLEQTSIQQSDFALIQPALDAHRATYDGTKVQACADAIQNGGCSFFTTRLQSACPGLITGTVDAGGDCTLSAECKDGLYCKTSTTCPGTCTTLESVGGDCEKNDACKDGLVCSDATKKCIQQVAEGAGCGGTTKAECLAGLWCANATATASGTCKKIDEVYAVAEGSSCDPTKTLLCKSGLSCALTGLDATTQKLTYMCEKPATSTSCHAGYPETCPVGQYCELTGLVAVPPSVGGTCKPLPGDGAPCASANPADTSKSFCTNTAVCVSGTCHAIQNLGAACTTNEECFSKVCAKGTCEPNDCAGAAK
jgi:hypothetical protein